MENVPTYMDTGGQSPSRPSPRRLRRKLRGDLKEEADKFDHTLIYEEGSLSEKTEAAMLEEGFSMLKLPFRPTAENLSKHFYELMTAKGYRVKLCRVYETPENVAEYSE